MKHSVEWPAGHMARWHDEQWWEALIDGATADPDPVSANARITLVHKELSLALTRVIGQAGISPIRFRGRFEGRSRLAR